MATENLSKIACRLLLNNGTSSGGTAKTVTVNYPNISRTGYTADRAFTIATLMEPCLAKTINAIQSVKTSSITSA